MSDCCEDPAASSGGCGSCGDGCCKGGQSNTTAELATTTTATTSTRPLSQGTKTDEMFDELFFLEESIINKGIKEGLEAGKRAGFKDAYDMGYANGKDIGKEIGFYHGHVLGWNALIAKFPDLFSERGQKTVKKLETLIANCTVNTANENLQQQLEEIQTVYPHFRFLTSISFL